MANEIFIKTLKNKIGKCLTLISKNVYIDKLGNIVNECNNTYHKTIKMKPADVKLSTYIDLKVANNDKNSKFEVAMYESEWSWNVCMKCKNIKTRKQFCKSLHSKLVWRIFCYWKS